MDITPYLKIESLISNGMSEFQMERFVINDQITFYRKLKQAVMEIRGRLENITFIGFDLEELQIKLEEAVSNKNSTEVNSFDARRFDVQIRKTEFEINRKQLVIDQQKKEVEFFLQTVNSVIKEYNGIDNLVHLLSDPDFHFEQEKIFWSEKFTRSATCDIVATGSISKGVLEAVGNLPPLSADGVIIDAITGGLKAQTSMNNARTQYLVEHDK